MDLPWGDARTGKFSTGVGLITTNGPHGYNIMACEWTHQLSYSPGIIAICIGVRKGAPEKATLENIRKTGFFGVSLAAVDQNVLSSVAGGSSGRDVDKIAVLKELGFNFFKAKKIDVFLVEGSAMQAECKLVFQKTFGNHILFAGEVVELYPANEKKPLVYHNTKYSAPGAFIPKPGAEELERIKKIVEKHRKH